MAKDKSGNSGVTRIDLRIPNQIFNQIESIAIETNQPKHHRSGKVVTTPVILNLISLGLEAVRKEDFNLEFIATKESLREAEIEKKLLNTLNQKIEDILSDKLDDIITDKVKALINKGSREKVGTIIEDGTKSSEQIKSNVTDNISDSKADKKSQESIDSTKTLLPYDKAVEKIKQWNSEGKSLSSIAKRLTGKYYTSQGKTKWNHGQVGRVVKSF